MIPEWLPDLIFFVVFFLLGASLGLILSQLAIKEKQAEIDRMRDYLNKLEDLK